MGLSTTSSYWPCSANTGMRCWLADEAVDEGQLIGAPHFDQDPCLNLHNYPLTEWNGLLFERGANGVGLSISDGGPIRRWGVRRTVGWPHDSVGADFGLGILRRSNSCLPAVVSRRAGRKRALFYRQKKPRASYGEEEVRGPRF